MVAFSDIVSDFKSRYIFASELERLLGRIKSCLIPSRYFQVWALLWLGALIVFFVGFGNVVHRSAVDEAQGSYHSWRFFANDLSSPGVRFPNMLLTPYLAGVTIKEVGCQTENGFPVATKRYAPTSRTWVIEGSGVIANSLLNTLGCIVILDGAPNTTQLRWEPASTGTVKRAAEAVYTDTNTITTIAVRKSRYELRESDGSAVRHEWIMWDPRINQRIEANVQNAIEVLIMMDSFIVMEYRAFYTYQAWQVFADIGGLAFMSYMLHAFVMFAIGRVLTNDSRTLGGARGQYDTVE